MKFYPDFESSIKIFDGLQGFEQKQRLATNEHEKTRIFGIISRQFVLIRG